MALRNRLTAVQVKQAKPGVHVDGGGLMLVVKKTGTRKWIFRFMLNGKRRDMGLGPYPDISLSQAREKAREARLLVAQGIDPIKAKQSQRKATPTFRECAIAFLQQKRGEWKNQKHAKQWESTLATYAFPVIGDTPVDQITTDDMKAILTPIWKTKTETAKRLQGRIENVLAYATACKYRAGDNPARWRGHLDAIFPKPTKTKKTIHHPAMPFEAVPAFMQELHANESMASKALQFLILTATRTGEVLGATWQEIDWKNAVWVIPVERMKASKEHRVPLSPSALELLKALPTIESNPYLFTGQSKGKPLSNMALLQAMRRMGYGPNGKHGPYVPHGFRASFRTWAGELSPFPKEVIEQALAHALESKVEAAYMRGDQFTKRRLLMEAWNQFCNTPQDKEGEVIQLFDSKGTI